MKTTTLSQASRGALLLMGLGAASLVSCADPVDVPVGPDMDALTEDYEHPEGTVSTGNVSTLVEAASDEISFWNELGQLLFVVESIKGSAEAAKEAAGDKSNVSVSGSTHIEIICPGTDETPSVDPENGTVELTLGLRDSFLKRSIGGDFHNCGMNFERRSIVLDGSLDMDFGRDIALFDLEFDETLVRFKGTIDFGDGPENISVDARSIRGELFEIRIPADDGDVIFSFADDLTEVALRTGDDSYCCNFDEKYCEQLDGDSCEAARTGMRLSW